MYNRRYLHHRKTTQNQKLQRCDTVFEAMGCFYHFCDCQQKEKVTSEILKRWNKRKKTMTRSGNLISLGKDFKWSKFGNVVGGSTLKKTRTSERDWGQNFPFRKPLSELQIMIKKSTLFGYVC